jgi:hypothetical protein
MEDFESMGDCLGGIDAQVPFKEPPDMPLEELQAEPLPTNENCLIQLTTKYFYRNTAEKRSAWTLWY